jgi:tetratricopeptide (TPR) repeat protein
MIDITDKKSLENIFAQDFGSPYFPILADLYLQKGDFRRAKTVCEVGLRHDSGNDFGKFIMAKVALAEEKPAVAEKWLKQVVKDNPSNFNALRMLIRLEFILKRSPKTIHKYIQYILQYIPNDIECQGWLQNIADISDKLPKEKKMAPKKTNDLVSGEVSETKPKLIKEKYYNLEESMATFTMLQVLKSQKHYQQALAVLKMLEAKKMDVDRISKERGEIQSLLLRETKT